MPVVRRTSASRYRSFWQAQSLFLSRLYRSRLVSLACIRGSCPAAGCILALCCDHRVMSSEGEARIGLNEVALGIGVPLYWQRVLVLSVGHRRAERLLSKGQLVPASEALSLGLVDALAATSGLQAAAEREMRERLQLPDAGRVRLKQDMRGELSRQWEAGWQQEAEQAWQMLTEQQTVEQLGRVLQRLSAAARERERSRDKEQDAQRPQRPAEPAQAKL